MMGVYYFPALTWLGRQFLKYFCDKQNCLVREARPSPGGLVHEAEGPGAQTSGNPLSDCTWLHVFGSKGLAPPPAACFQDVYIKKKKKKQHFKTLLWFVGIP